MESFRLSKFYANLDINKTKHLGASKDLILIHNNFRKTSNRCLHSFTQTVNNFIKFQSILCAGDMRK